MYIFGRLNFHTNSDTLAGLITDGLVEKRGYRGADISNNRQKQSVSTCVYMYYRIVSDTRG